MCGVHAETTGSRRVPVPSCSAGSGASVLRGVPWPRGRSFPGGISAVGARVDRIFVNVTFEMCGGVLCF